MALIIDKKRSIGEAAKEVGVPEHVLRFWEKEFHEYIQPVLGVGGRRYYYNDDIAVLLAIKKYLKDDGYTIKGLNNLFKNNEIDLRCGANMRNEAVKETIIAQESATDTGFINGKTGIIGNIGNIRYDLKNLKHKMNKFYEKLKEV
jgi:DNA-binding transcriptional MerR regulator